MLPFALFIFICTVSALPRIDEKPLDNSNNEQENPNSIDNGSWNQKSVDDGNWNLQTVEDGRWNPDWSNWKSVKLSDGRWVPEAFGDTGKYIPDDRGKYIHIPNPYIHINNPYDGGYGPYAHQRDPYLDAASQIHYELIVTPPKDIPYYKDGYYRNNGIKIIKQKHNYDEDKYDFLFETENKIKQEEKAAIKNANTPDEGIATSGFYEYIGPDGFKYRTTYTADENGFRPKTERLETQYSGKWQKIKVNGLGDRVY